MKSLHEIYYRFPAEFPLPFILDGATGTALMRDGMPRRACPESWILENPEVLRKIQASYVLAGSDAVFAPTFGANAPNLSRHGITGKTADYNRALAAVSADNPVRAPFIGGDISPTGLFMEPYGDAAFEQIAAVYAEQAAALDDIVDFYAIETMISLAEARAAAVGIKDVSRKPVFATLTVEKNGRTMSGDTLEASLISLAALGVSAFGCNCSAGPADILAALKPLVPLAAALGVPLIAKPNAGLPVEEPDGTRRFDFSADEFGNWADAFLKEGIFILGGCCGTDCTHIAAIKKNAVSFDASKYELPSALPETGRLACTNKAVGSYNESSAPAVSVTEDIADDINDSDGVPLVTVESEDEAEMLLSCAYLIERPFAVSAPPSALSLILRRYNGRPLVVTGAKTSLS